MTLPTPSAPNLVSLLLPVFHTPRPSVIFGSERPDCITTQLRLLQWLLLALGTELKLLPWPGPWVLPSSLHPPPWVRHAPAVLASFYFSNTPPTPAPCHLLSSLPGALTPDPHRAPALLLPFIQVSTEMAPPLGDALTSLRWHLPFMLLSFSSQHLPPLTSLAWESLFLFHFSEIISRDTEFIQHVKYFTPLSSCLYDEVSEEKSDVILTSFLCGKHSFSFWLLSRFAICLDFLPFQCVVALCRFFGIYPAWCPLLYYIFIWLFLSCLPHENVNSWGQGLCLIHCFIPLSGIVLEASVIH